MNWRRSKRRRGFPMLGCTMNSTEKKTERLVRRLRKAHSMPPELPLRTAHVDKPSGGWDGDDPRWELTPHDAQRYGMLNHRQQRRFLTRLKIE
jgi:hypothetical protein